MKTRHSSMPKCCFPKDGNDSDVSFAQCGADAPSMSTLNATPKGDWPDKNCQIWIAVPLCARHQEMLSKARKGECLEW